MSDNNLCWNCKYNLLKLEILVPQNSTIKECIHETPSDFNNTDILAIMKANNGHYNMWFRSEGDMKLLRFKMLLACKLNEQRNPEVCEKFILKNEGNRLSVVSYSKTPLVKTKVEPPKASSACEAEKPRYPITNSEP
jgi:hypothetical protein